MVLDLWETSVICIALSETSDWNQLVLQITATACKLCLVKAVFCIQFKLYCWCNILFKICKINKLRWMRLKTVRFCKWPFVLCWSLSTYWTCSVTFLENLLTLFCSKCWIFISGYLLAVEALIIGSVTLCADFAEKKSTEDNSSCVFLLVLFEKPG